MTLSLRQQHRLFLCMCKSHQELMKQHLLLLVLDWNRHSRTSSITKVVGKVNQVVGKPLMGCSAVILEPSFWSAHATTTRNRNSLVDFGLTHFLEWNAYAALIFSNMTRPLQGPNAVRPSQGFEWWWEWVRTRTRMSSNPNVNRFEPECEQVRTQTQTTLNQNKNKFWTGSMVRLFMSGTVYTGNLKTLHQLDLNYLLHPIATQQMR